jgi:hypothetical protein
MGKDFPPLSEEFREALRKNCGAGSISIYCECCGRHHFSEDPNEEGFFDEGDLEGLRVKQNREPDKYISHDHSPSFMTLMGKQYVPDCQCNSAKPFEDFLRQNPDLVADFYESLAIARQREAKTSSGISGRVTASLR